MIRDEADENVPRIHSTKFMAVALMAVGGFVNAYTFIQRGGVLAAGQTGNIIFMSVNVVNHDFLGVKTKLATMLAFALGCFIEQILKETHRYHYWRISALLVEMLVFFVVGWLPKSTPNMIVGPALAFVMAMQTTAFSDIQGMGYNNVFTTGNIKKSMVTLATYLVTGRRKQLRTSLTYLELVLGFAFGAMISALLQNIYAEATIWWASALVALIAVGYGIAIYQRNKNYYQ